MMGLSRIIHITAKYQAILVGCVMMEIVLGETFIYYYDNFRKKVVIIRCNGNENSETPRNIREDFFCHPRWIINSRDWELMRNHRYLVIWLFIINLIVIIPKRPLFICGFNFNRYFMIYKELSLFFTKSLINQVENMAFKLKDGDEELVVDLDDYKVTEGVKSIIKP